MIGTTFRKLICLREPNLVLSIDEAGNLVEVEPYDPDAYRVGRNNAVVRSIKLTVNEPGLDHDVLMIDAAGLVMLGCAMHPAVLGHVVDEDAATIGRFAAMAGNVMRGEPRTLSEHHIASRCGEILALPFSVH